MGASWSHAGYLSAKGTGNASTRRMVTGTPAVCSRASTMPSHSGMTSTIRPDRSSLGIDVAIRTLPGPRCSSSACMIRCEAADHVLVAIKGPLEYHPDPVAVRPNHRGDIFGRCAFSVDRYFFGLVVDRNLAEAWLLPVSGQVVGDIVHRRHGLRRHLLRRPFSATRLCQYLTGQLHG